MKEVVHKLSCNSRHKERGQFAKYPCNCGAEKLATELAALREVAEAARPIAEFVNCTAPEFDNEMTLDVYSCIKAGEIRALSSALAKLDALK